MKKPGTTADWRKHRLEELYKRCINGCSTAEQCPGIWKNIADGLPPRGFYYERAPVDLLAVAKNPGHPLNWERKRYRSHSGRSLLDACRRFHDDLHTMLCQEPGHRFHKSLFRYLSYLLDSPESDPYQRGAHTDLVKCSTPNEQDSLETQTKEECYRHYLRREVELFAPKVLLAHGRDVAEFLHSHEWEWGIPVIYIRHPSIYYPKDEEEEILADIKRKVQHAMKLGEG